MPDPIDRRQFLTGQVASRFQGPSHISSALVLAFPDRRADIAEQIWRLPDTEVHGIENGKIVVVLEGADIGVGAASSRCMPRHCPAIPMTATRWLRSSPTWKPPSEPRSSASSLMPVSGATTLP